MRAAA
jgi:hypothetical protein